MARDYFASIDLNGNQIIDARLENLASFPGAGKAGRLVWNTATLLMGVDNGSAFRSLAFLDGPTFTGVPAAPTAAPGTSTTQLATTAFVAAAVTGGSVADGDKGDIVVSSTGSVWTVDAGAITLAKMANLAANSIIGNNTGSAATPLALTATQVRTLINVANGATANSSDATLLARANHTGTQLASTISDLSTAVTTIIASYVDTEAGAESALDTIAEMVVRLADLSDDIANVIQRHNQTFGDGTATSYAITHNLASDDVTVEVYEVATKATVLCDVVRTSTNVVTLTVNPAPATNALRVVIKK